MLKCARCTSIDSFPHHSYHNPPPGGVAVVLVDVATRDQEQQDGADERQAGAHGEKGPRREWYERVPGQLVTEKTERAEYLTQTHA